MLVIVGLVFLLLICRVAWSRLLGRRAFVTGCAVFLAYQVPAIFGFVVGVKPDDSFGIFWAAMCLLGLGSFVWGACFANRHYNFRPAIETDMWRQSPVLDDLDSAVTTVALLGAVLVCLVMGLLFARRVGYNTLGIGLHQLLHTGAVDLATISRKRADATLSKYNAAGYTAQFTAVILPVIILLLWSKAKVARNGLLRLVLVALTIVDVYFLSIAGGRGWLVWTALMVAFFALAPTSPLPRSLGRRGASAVIVVVAVVLIFGFTTILQGRSRSQSTGAGLIELSTQGVYDRVAGDYSKEQLQLIRLVHAKAPVYGAEWLGQLTQLYANKGPGHIVFDQRLYALVYKGDTTGDLPLGVWAATYYNWGPLGMIAVNFLVGFLMQAFTIKYLIRKPRNLSAVVIFSVVGYRLAFWIDPYTLLLQGAPTLLLFYGLIRLLKGRQQQAVGSTCGSASMHAGISAPQQPRSR